MSNDPRDNLIHLSPDERADLHPCLCSDCLRQRPERRLLLIKEIAYLKKRFSSRRIAEYLLNQVEVVQHKGRGVGYGTTGQKAAKDRDVMPRRYTRKVFA